MPDSSRRAKLLFAGFHPLILEDCRLKAGDAYDVETLSTHKDTLLPAVDRMRPDVVLFELPDASSLGMIQMVRGIRPPCQVVVLTGTCRTDATEAIFSAGASAILYRLDAPAELFVAVQAALSGQRYLSSTFMKGSTGIAEKRVRRSLHPSASDELVLRLIARDYPAHRIAQALGLSVATVRLSIASFKRQFGSRTNRDLKRHAITHYPVTGFL
jgi:DNA-binding NarL/FixJ family response regulator